MRMFCRVIVLVFFSVVFFCSAQALASSSPFSLRTYVGATHLPITEWSDFSRGMSNSYFQKSNPNIYYGFSVSYTVGNSHSITLGTELIKTSAAMSSLLILTDYQGDTTGFVPFVIKWKFQGVPITLGYEYKLTTFNDRFSPFAGIGASYFVSKVEAEVIYYAETDFLDSVPKSKRTGNGYGFHASLGLTTKLTESLFMISQVRYRVSDGMAFTDKKDDIKVEFTGFDFSIGLGWNF